ncbi:hypothetical protein BFP70_00025 [Thioclava sp. SK-1]|uniref:efflux RND transporter periplasmic adaptor subunit n=1 Tax=Thioclava sp. SK-1 TaxID=1889770 RepID=UPI000824AD04|nr:efflux RND transporter periplasmic adaptor subunit [Thioclava sp. SK-1]OCX66598.1 hypothetical protein BFP70_00025 [Thioclava sp. SK-1]
MPRCFALVLSLMLVLISQPGTAQPLHPVVSEIVAADPVVQRSFAGTVQARTKTALAFRAAGRVATLTVEAGDRVTRGQVLAQLDQITLQQDLESANAAVDAAQADAQLAAQQFTRVQTLFDRGVASTAALEQARANRDAANAQQDSARAQQAQARDAAGYGTLTAPRDGIVLSTSVEVGTLVLAGTEIATLASYDAREAVIDLPADLAMLFAPGAVFEIRHSSPGLPVVTGHLRLIEPLTETSIDTRRARIVLRDPPADFRIGSLIQTRPAPGTGPSLTVPESAIVTQGAQSYVWRVGPGRIAQRIAITPGPKVSTPNGTRRTVTQGLSAGDEIILRGVSALTEGLPLGERLP